MSDQLSLALSLRDEATFANFYAAPGSVRAQATAALVASVDTREPLVYLWGGCGTGISHVLQATCHHYLQAGLTVQYLPLEDVAGFDPDSLLAGLELQSLVCLEGLEHIVGNKPWERGLFGLFNKLRDRGNSLVVSAVKPPRELGLELADLQSRLSCGLTCHFAPYSDGDKLAIIRFRGGRLGIELSEEVAAFILSRGDRNMDNLITSLRRLDSAALKAQRRVTIPFVKEVFGW